MKLQSNLEGLSIPLIGAVLLLINLLIPVSSIAYLTTAILAILAFIKPKESILFLLIYFPLRSFLTEVNPSLKLIGDLVIIFIFLKVLWDARGNIKSIFNLAIYEWAFLVFLLVGAVSGYFTGVSIGAIVFQLRAFVITFLLLYIVKRLDITKRDIFNFLVVTASVAALLVVQGLVEKLSMRSAWMPENWVNRQLSSTNSSRIYGLMNNPNVLAVQLTVAAILTYHLRSLLSKPSLRWLLTILIVLMSGVWILTFSRGTWIAVAVGLAVYFLFTLNWKFIMKTGIVVGLGLIVVALPVISLSGWIENNTHIGDFERTGAPEEEVDYVGKETTRVKETFTADTIEKSKTTGRLFIVSKGFEVFRDNPIIGAGFATFGDSASKSYSSPLYEAYGIDVNIYSDNQYIQIFAQTGIVGVLLFAVFLLGMLYDFWKHRRSIPSAVPLIATLIAVYWCGLIYNIWEDKTFTLYYYIIAAAFLTLARKNEQTFKE